MFSNILITIHNNYSGAEDHHTYCFLVCLTVNWQSWHPSSGYFVVVRGLWMSSLCPWFT